MKSRSRMQEMKQNLRILWAWMRGKNGSFAPP